MIEKVYVSWKWVDEKIEVLANKINNKEFKAITGIPRGGLIPAVMLSHKLGVKYVPFNRFDSQVIYPDKDILVIDDISDSGDTLINIGDKGYKTATLCYRYSTKRIPEYYGEEIKNDMWIVFPWEENDSKTIQGYLENKK